MPSEMNVDVRQLIYICWALFLATWVLWGVTAKQVRRRQSGVSRLVQSIVTIPAFWLLFASRARTAPLNFPILPYTPVTAPAALALTVIGFGIAIWARLHLGGNWSATVTVKEEHALIQTGPYAYVRHPIYSGFTLGAMGLAILNGDLFSLAGIALMLFGWFLKFRLEERFMIEEFGDTYLSYKRNVKALIPFVW
jgi:protein-S-isoprenylcysteine O-methyltransferase